MTAYEMRISDWSSDVCSSDLSKCVAGRPGPSTSACGLRSGRTGVMGLPADRSAGAAGEFVCNRVVALVFHWYHRRKPGQRHPAATRQPASSRGDRVTASPQTVERSEEHTSELQSLMRISYAVFCLKKKNKQY